MMKIEKASLQDASAIGTVAQAAGLFPADMMPDLITQDPDAVWLVAKDNGQVAGFTFTRPEPLTDGTWNMLALAVEPTRHRTGIARDLVQATETALQAQNVRLLVVDTASGVEQSAARAFYQATGYVHTATLPDFWAKGEDKITYLKSL